MSRPVQRIMLLTIVCLLLPGMVRAMTLTDAAGRNVEVPDKVSRVICSGPGCLRLLTYLQAQEMAVAVDDIETRRNRFDARPYALANPQFKKLPTFGEFRGHDNPELILTLEPQPQVIFKTYATMGHDPVELQKKTGIPVVILEYGTLGKNKAKFDQALRIMAQVVGKKDRAEEIIAFFDKHIAAIRARTKDVPGDKRPGVYIGGVASKGPHGYQSTEPGYPPFMFLNARNLAYRTGLNGKELRHADVAKEKIVEWNPDYLFLDLSTLQMGEGSSGLDELKNDPAYQSLTAVQENKVIGLLPYNWYTTNYGSVLANAYGAGKILYPELFEDVDPAKMADEIYTFLVGKPVFADMNGLFDGLAYKPVPVK